MFSAGLQKPYTTFIEGAISSYIEDTLVVITSLLVGVPLLTVVKKVLNLKNPLSCLPIKQSRRPKMVC